MQLGNVLSQGGEGFIHDVPGLPHLVAKIWREPGERQARKLDVLLRHPPNLPYESTARFELAWPSDVLRDEQNVVRGYLMPRVPLDQYHELVTYCIPASRRTLETARGSALSHVELLTIARNVAEAFQSLHRMGHLIGDVNNTNILVRGDGKAFFIDLDSIQAADPDTSEVHRCTVGKEDFTPPKLMGQRFEDMDREAEDDLFGLAVLIFQLLMNGVHPYDPVDQTGGQGQVRQDNIRRGHSPYINLDLTQARAILDLGMIADLAVRDRTRDNMLALIGVEATADFDSILGPRISSWLELEPEFRELFRRAFANDSDARPTPGEWVRVLDSAGAATRVAVASPQPAQRAPQTPSQPTPAQPVAPTPQPPGQPTPAQATAPTPQTSGQPTPAQPVAPTPQTSGQPTPAQTTTPTPPTTPPVSPSGAGQGRGRRIWTFAVAPPVIALLIAAFFVIQEVGVDLYDLREEFQSLTGGVLPPPPEVASDREALIAFYRATGGPNWANSHNWLSDRHMDEWHGVVINRSGHVIGLYLNGNDLSGVIPPELGNLSNLQTLSLNRNFLSGVIRPELGNLSNLRTLYLSDNNLINVIPPELGNLSNLQALSLSNNLLSGVIPPELGNLSNLQTLYLSNNNLSGVIPPELGNLSNLQTLSLSGNNLSGCVPENMSESNLAGLGLLSCAALEPTHTPTPIPAPVQAAVPPRVNPDSIRATATARAAGVASPIARRQPTAAPRPTITPRPTATPRPTITPRPTAAPNFDISESVRIRVREGESIEHVFAWNHEVYGKGIPYLTEWDYTPVWFSSFKRIDDHTAAIAIGADDDSFHGNGRAHVIVSNESGNMNYLIDVTVIDAGEPTSTPTFIPTPIPTATPPPLRETEEYILVHEGDFHIEYFGWDTKLYGPPIWYELHRSDEGIGFIVTELEVLELGSVDDHTAAVAMQARDDVHDGNYEMLVHVMNEQGNRVHRIYVSVLDTGEVPTTTPVPTATPIPTPPPTPVVTPTSTPVPMPDLWLNYFSICVEGMSCWEKFEAMPGISGGLRVSISYVVENLGQAPTQRPTDLRLYADGQYHEGEYIMGRDAFIIPNLGPGEVVQVWDLVKEDPSDFWDISFSLIGENAIIGIVDIENRVEEADDEYCGNLKRYRDRFSARATDCNNVLYVEGLHFLPTPTPTPTPDPDQPPALFAPEPPRN